MPLIAGFGMLIHTKSRRTGNVKHKIHIGFDDPDAFVGSPEEVLPEFRRVRDEILQRLQIFADSI